MNWSLSNIPFQDGKLVIVTGSSSGLGLETAKVLAAKGAEVIVATRDPAKGTHAVSRIGRLASFEALDLANLGSVKAFAARLIEKGRPIDILINNAGLAAPPKRQTTYDGFELQFGTNFLGHFALTARLMPLLLRGASPRVVTVSSLVDKRGRIDFEDLMSERRYSPTRSYSQSKLADLIFSRELQRRADAKGWGLLSVAAHPGMAKTELTKARPGQAVLRINTVVDALLPLIGQTAEQGALPILYAATAPDLPPASYYGPSGFLELKGSPAPASSSASSRDPKLAVKLWLEAERLTAVKL